MTCLRVGYCGAPQPNLLTGRVTHGCVIVRLASVSVDDWKQGRSKLAIFQSESTRQFFNIAGSIDQSSGRSAARTTESERAIGGADGRNNAYILEIALISAIRPETGSRASIDRRDRASIDHATGSRTCDRSAGPMPHKLVTLSVGTFNRAGRIPMSGAVVT